MSVTYRSNDNKAGAVPVDTVIKTTSTTDGQVQHVNVDTNTLATGAATAANQASALTALANLLTELQLKADLTETQPISNTDDFYLEVAKGNVSGHYSVNKFGAAPSGIQTTDTDIWGRADAVPTQSIWLAPTAARVHALVSSSTDDAVGGIGAVSVTVYGLQTWDTAETSETKNLNGTTPVNTDNSYVIIHRMIANPGATTTTPGVNVGTISATAAVDATITAIVAPGNGQTEMAIYGVPSTQKAYITRWSVNIDRTSAAAATADFRMKVNPNPDVQTVAFQRKDDISVQSTGTNAMERHYRLPKKINGPCIIKIQATASANDIDGESGFDLILVDN